MAREIKFRGKYIKDKSWIYGGYGYLRKSKKHYITSQRAFFRVIPETVGQFTGLEDAEDNEIFEGDFIQNTAHEELIYKIEWRIDCWVGVDKFDDDFLLGDLLDAAPLEAIGNIHDNPELVKYSNK